MLEVKVNEQDWKNCCFHVSLKYIYTSENVSQLFPKDTLFETKTNYLILSTNPVLMDKITHEEMCLILSTNHVLDG